MFCADRTANGMVIIAEIVVAIIAILMVSSIELQIADNTAKFGGKNFSITTYIFPRAPLKAPYHIFLRLDHTKNIDS